jgi:hypothetical protein
LPALAVLHFHGAPHRGGGAAAEMMEIALVGWHARTKALLRDCAIFEAGKKDAKSNETQPNE